MSPGRVGCAAEFLDQADVAALMAPCLIHVLGTQGHAGEPGAVSAAGEGNLVGADEPLGQGPLAAAVEEAPSGAKSATNSVEGMIEGSQ